MLLTDVLVAYEAERLPIVVAKQKLISCVRRLTAAIGDVELDGQSSLAAAVGRYLKLRLAQDVAEATVRRELIVLRAAVRAAWKSGLLPTLLYVAAPGQGPSRQRWLTEIEARKVLKHAEGDMRLFLLLALCTGARIGAILELTWDRVDLQLGVIDYRTPGSPRRKHRAVAPIATVLRQALEEARPAQRRGKRVISLSPETIRRRLKRIARACRIKPFGPHALRHTVATWLLSGGRAQLVTASRLLGHRSIATTEQVYAHLLPQHLHEAAEILGASLTPPERVRLSGEGPRANRPANKTSAA